MVISGRNSCVLASLICGLSVIACSDQSTPTASSEPAQPSPAYTPPPEQPAVDVQRWTYREDRDPMDDRKTKLACATSSDTVSLDWPYKPTTADICLRNSPKFGKDIYFVLNNDGQIICSSYDGCTVRIRIDDAPAERIQANTAADHSSNILFLSGSARLAQRLAKAKTLAVEAQYYQAGQQAVTFDVEGLDLNKAGFAAAKK